VPGAEPGQQPKGCQRANLRAPHDEVTNRLSCETLQVAGTPQGGRLSREHRFASVVNEPRGDGASRRSHNPPFRRTAQVVGAWQAIRLHPVSGDPRDCQNLHIRLAGRIGCFLRHRWVAPLEVGGTGNSDTFRTAGCQNRCTPAARGHESADDSDDSAAGTKMPLEVDQASGWSRSRWIRLHHEKLSSCQSLVSRLRFFEGNGRLRIRTFLAENAL